MSSVTVSNQELRVALLGVTGNGKSTTGNKIARAEIFPTHGSCSTSVTKECKEYTVTRNGRRIKLVDTPGFLDTDLSFTELEEKLIPFIGMTCPGPHVILYVIKAGRFTSDNKMALDMMEEMFGKRIFDFTIFVFTHLSNDSTEDLYYTSMHKDLKYRVDICKNRCVFLPQPSHRNEYETKVQELLTMAYKLNSANGGTYFTNEMFQAQQRTIEEKKKQEREKNEREERQRQLAIEREIQERERKRIADLEAQARAARQAEQERHRCLEEARKRQEETDKEAERLREDAKITQAIADVTARNRNGGAVLMCHYRAYKNGPWDAPNFRKFRENFK